MNDPIPVNTTYLSSSMTLNGAVLTDAADADAGEFSATGPAVAIQLGDITAADGPQVVEFVVVID